MATGTWKTAAAATSRQSCPTLSDPIDGSPPGSPVPGILQARALQWGAIAFSNTENCWAVKPRTHWHTATYRRVTQREGANPHKFTHTACCCRPTMVPLTQCFWNSKMYKGRNDEWFPEAGGGVGKRWPRLSENVWASPVMELLRHDLYTGQGHTHNQCRRTGATCIRADAVSGRDKAQQPGTVHSVKVSTGRNGPGEG